MARSTARKRAFNTLFEADVRGQEITDLLDARIVYPGAQTPLPDYAIEIVRGVASHRRTIDKALGEALDSWEVSRMPAVDRNLARIAAWEIIYNDDVASGVAIDEAIALAKTYAGDETPDLLYGVLSTSEKKVEEIRQEEIEWQNYRAAQAEASEGSENTENSEADTSAENAKNFEDIQLSDFDSQPSADSTSSENSEKSQIAEVSENSEETKTDTTVDPAEDAEPTDTFFIPQEK